MSAAEKTSLWPASPLARAALAFALGLGVAALLLRVIAPVLPMLALSLLLYAAIAPWVNRMCRRDVPRERAVVLATLLVIPGMLAAGLLLFPMLTAQVRQLSLQTELVDARLAMLLAELRNWSAHWLGFDFDAAHLAHDLVRQVAERMNAAERRMLSWFNDIAFSLLLVPLITFFLLRDFRRLRNGAMQLLPNRWFEPGWLIYERVAGQLQAYVRGISLQTLIMAAICSLGFALVGLDYAPLLGMLTGLLNLIPFFGIALAKIPPLVVVLLSDASDLWQALGALGVVFLAQAVDSVFVLPRIVARSASLHPLGVMLAVVLGGYYFSFAGLILAVPVVFTLKVLFAELHRGMRHFSRRAEEAGQA